MTYLGESHVGIGKITYGPSQVYDVSYTDRQSGKITGLTHLSIQRAAGLGYVSDYFSGGFWRNQPKADFTRIANYLAK